MGANFEFYEIVEVKYVGQKFSKITKLDGAIFGITEDKLCIVINETREGKIVDS